MGRYEKEIEHMFDFSAERVIQSVKQSLQLLDLEYVDIIQGTHKLIRTVHTIKSTFFCGPFSRHQPSVHDLEFAQSLDQIVNETLPALQQLVDQGTNSCFPTNI